MSSSPTTGRPLAAALAALGVSSFLLACQGPHEIRYETQHLRIGTDFDEPLCRGYLDHLELVVTTTETALAADVDKPIEVYLWSDLTWDAEGLCDADDGLGCFERGVVYSGLYTADHEIIHGVIHAFADPASFWDEGTASGFSERTRFSRSPPVPNLELDLPELSYGASSAFARWLFETRGPELYQELIRHRGGGRDAFESVYDMTAEEAQEEYFETSPYSYGVLVACEHAALPSVGPREWAESIDLDCDNEHVWGGPYGMGARRVMEISERGFYSFSTTADVLTIARCQDVDLDEPPVLGDPAMGDVPFMTPTFPEFSVWFSGSDGPVSYDLAPGRYEVIASQAGHEPHTYEVTVTADPGPVPQTPESTP